MWWLVLKLQNVEAQPSGWHRHGYILLLYWVSMYSKSQCAFHTSGLVHYSARVAVFCCCAGYKRCYGGKSSETRRNNCVPNLKHKKILWIVNIYSQDKTVCKWAEVWKLMWTVHSWGDLIKNRISHSIRRPWRAAVPSVIMCLLCCFCQHVVHLRTVLSITVKSRVAQNANKMNSERKPCFWNHWSISGPVKTTKDGGFDGLTGEIEGLGSKKGADICEIWGGERSRVRNPLRTSTTGRKKINEMFW